MRNTAMTAAIIGAFLFPAALLAAPEGWHKNLEDGRTGPEDQHDDVQDERGHHGKEDEGDEEDEFLD